MASSFPREYVLQVTDKALANGQPIEEVVALLLKALGFPTEGKSNLPAPLNENEPISAKGG